MAKIYVFPGQGAQRVGMGAALFDKYPAQVKVADEILGYSIRRLCVEDPEKVLDKTEYTQPALYVVNALSYLEKRAGADAPDYAAGHSLGEYNALLAAEAFDFADGLRIVQRRGQLMARAYGGGMAAVIGLPEERIVEVLRAAGLESIDVANFNSPSQIVVSGPREDIERAVAPLTEAGARHVALLRVSAAFHSRYMADAARDFRDFLRRFAFAPLRFPVLSNVHALAYEDDAIVDTLAKQIASAVRWTEIVRRLLGVADAEFEEVGPGKVLTGLLRQVRAESTPLVGPLRAARPAPRVLNGEARGRHMDRAAHTNGNGHAAYANGNGHAAYASGNGHAAYANGNGHAAYASGNGHAPVANGNGHAVYVDGNTAYANGNGHALAVEPAVYANGNGHANVVELAAYATGNGHANGAERAIARSSNELRGRVEIPRELRVAAERLGSSAFRREFGLRYAYYAGAMYRGIASEELVVAMGRSGFMGFFGTGGLSADRVRAAIRTIQERLGGGAPYGMNFLHEPSRPEHEAAMADLFVECGVRTVEAAAFMDITPALVLYRVAGLRRGQDGGVEAQNRIIAKVSRPEVAEAFLAPPPERILASLLSRGKITEAQRDMARCVLMADALTVESDSGGHTDQGVAFALLPAMLAVRDRMARTHPSMRRVHVGAAGGLGTPQAIAAAFVIGADYVVTGSINQCSVESGASAAVKDLLQDADVQDTTMAPAGDMFELGAQVRVLRKGLFFPGRANKLYALYKQYDSLDDIDAKTRAQIEKNYFKRTFEQVWDETKRYFQSLAPAEIVKAESNPKHKMALVFRWYFGYSFRLAAEGKPENRVDYQIHCGPALGAFNAYVRGTELQPWGKRHVDQIGRKLMADAAGVLNERFTALSAAL